MFCAVTHVAHSSSYARNIPRPRISTRTVSQKKTTQISRKFLMKLFPATPYLEAPSAGQVSGTASTCSPTIRRSPASSSRLAVRRMPTTPSITCGRSYGTVITFGYQIISKIGPHACRQSRMRTSDKNSFASSRSLRKSSIKMSFVPRGSSTSDLRCPIVR